MPAECGLVKLQMTTLRAW